MKIGIDNFSESINIKEIEDELANRHLKRITEYELKGREEGQLDLPGDEEDSLSENEFSIRNEYKNDIQFLAKRGSPLLDEPHYRYKKLVNDSETLKTNIKDIQKNRISDASGKKDRKIDEAKKNHEMEIEKNNNKKKAVVLELQDAQHNYNEITKKIGRKEPIIYLKSTFLEYAILIFLGLFEIPLNFTVFANFLLPKIETYILSCLLVIAVPIISLYLGICFKQYEENRKYIAHIWFLLPLMTGLNITVSILRSNYIYEVTEVVPDITSTATFVFLSTLLLIVGIIISYLHHDKNQELVVAYDRYKREKERYAKKITPINAEENDENKKYSNIILEIEDVFNKEQLTIQNLIPNLNNEIKETVEKHDSILNSFKALEKMVDSNYKTCIAKYRAENLKARTNHKRPNSWKEVKKLEFELQKKEELDPNKEITNK